MILIKNITKNLNVTFENTKFPDGTSQAWKLNPQPAFFDTMRITWQFQDEVEFVTVLQLAFILESLTRKIPHIYTPFLPYARQDKSPSNEETFAALPMLGALKRYNLSCFDAHSDKVVDQFAIDNITAHEFFISVLNSTVYDAIVFPDKGAKERYGHFFGCLPVIVMDKVRNQQTGEIEGLKIDDKNTDAQIKVGTGKILQFLMIDDICDGGRTFIEAAKVLHAENFLCGSLAIDLAVSHGIFSKGKQVLHDAGIRNILTTNSLAKNAGHFNVLF